MSYRNLTILLTSLLVSACATVAPSKDYTTFHQANPKSLLIVPVINHSAEVDAANLFLSTMAVPLAERGYYVFPTNMVKKLMEREGLSDPQLVHATDTRELAKLFKADAVLYVEILEWKSKYVVFASNIEVKFLYTLKDAHTGELLWQDERPFVYSQSAHSGNIFVDLAANAIKAAIDNGRADYTPVAAQANALALLGKGQGFPYGPHSPLYGKDSIDFPSSGTHRLTNAQSSAVAWPTNGGAHAASTAKPATTVPAAVGTATSPDTSSTPSAATPKPQSR